MAHKSKTGFMPTTTGDGKYIAVNDLTKLLNAMAADDTATAEENGLFVSCHPHTEPCIDLKMYMRIGHRMAEGESRTGVLVFREEGTYVFVEGLPTTERKAKRTPVILEGTCVNIHRCDETGELYAVLRRPKNMSFQQYCTKAAMELLLAADAF